MKFGLAAGVGLSWPDLLRMRSAAAATGGSATGAKTSIILVWLRGGCSHLDTYDPKPDSSSAYRSPFAPIETKTPGMMLTELLPRQAAIADKFTLLRSIAHTGGGHPAGSLQMLGGDRDRPDKLVPVLPDFMTVAHYLRRDQKRSLPNYVGVNPIRRYDNFQIAGPGFLGPSYEPFSVLGDPSAPQFEVPNIGMRDAAAAERMKERVNLRTSFDRLRRELDARGVMESVDEFHRQALTLLTSPEAKRAFDLSQEPDAVRDRYGRHAWGQQCLMARRLVEAGVEIVTTTFDGPLCGRVANWDDHAVNHHVFDALKFRAPFFDQAVSALIEDVYARGLDRRTLVVVTGEFGRTPKISHVASSGGGVASGEAGTVQPGRDHWPNANTILWAGGGIRTGQVIGATDARGEEAVQRRVGTHDFLATIYRHLGIDARKVAIPDFSGRPTPILSDGKPIEELS
ncbi:MAG TPA: DUF1501 domain-containing protein [Pirellulaceae bacterium]|nr:DUF1501 domain-containing protein [Pirellulaceae bacterium]